MGNYFFAKRTKSKENALSFFLFFINIEIATNFETIKLG
jgi:hypothetical protein